MINFVIFTILLKVQCFIGILGTNETDNLTYKIIYDNFIFLSNHQSKPLDIFILLEKTVVYIINRKIHGCLEIPDLFLVLNMKFLTRSLRHSCSTLEINPVFPRISGPD